MSACEDIAYVLAEIAAVAHARPKACPTCMLRIRDARGCLGRRDFLRIGGLGLGGFSLANLLQIEAFGAGVNTRPVTGKSVIFLFLHGGPSQTETFDPKMSAPAGVRSVTGEIDTALAGVTFGSTFPRLAALAKKLAIV